MTRMQMQGNAILNALAESAVTSALTMYEKKMLAESYQSMNRYDAVTKVLVDLDMSQESITYWLDEFFKISK